MNFKFRPGDKVVCIHPTIKKTYSGVYTVIEYTTEKDSKFVRTKEEGAFVEDWLELEAVINSPLMKALK